tara:strand:+ start:6603 stop:7190 length:588 start_codon:yes stop_codon:yes gene_type:complete
MVSVIVRDRTLTSQVKEMQWGFRTHLTRKMQSGSGAINARVETVSEKPLFRDSFRSRRCIVPADGFYEWQSTASGRQPYFVQLYDRAAFGFAGLWSQSPNQTGQLIHTFTILTTRANTLLSSLHGRMPVILNERDRQAWFNTETQDMPSKPFEKPYPSSRMTVTPVSKLVNNALYDSDDCLQTVTIPEELRLFAL